MEFILNECSLNRQYSSMEEFVGDLGNVVGCINIIRRNPVNTISKVNDFITRWSLNKNIFMI